MKPPNKLILDILDLSRGGAGVGRQPDGRVVFVPFTAPGDQVSVEITEESKNYARGKVIEIIKKSPNRVLPQCLGFTRCGGCQWQHVDYGTQWNTKLNGVKQALSRQGQLVPGHWDELPAERIWEYRNRVQLRGNKEKLGFFEPGSNELVPVERCEIARPEINAAWTEIRSEGSKRNGPYKVEVEVLPDGSVRKVWNSEHAALGFRQVHDDQNEKLKRWIENYLSGTEVLLDLYGGSGNLSESLDRKFHEIHCVDIGAPEQRLKGLSLQFHFHKKPVLEWVGELARSKKKFSGLSVISDPPREGIAQDIELLEKSVRVLGAQEWVLVGCNPDSWARDLAHMIRAGWKFERALVVDLFPQTHHVESVALLRL